MAKSIPQNPSELIFPRGQAVSFDPLAFDDAVRSQGIEFVHWRAMRCPVGLIDQYDTRRPHDDHSGCSNGFLYTRAGKFTALFIGNAMNENQQDLGWLDGSTVQVTLPRYYDGDSQVPVQVAPFDRLYLSEEAVTVPHWQLVEAHASGFDKLSRPAVAVTDLVDNQNQRYGPGDFELVNGQVHWLSQKQPGQDADVGRGRIYSIRYTYRPYWYVNRVVHEVRVAQVDNPVTGERVAMRMPQAVWLQREYVAEKEEKDEQAPDPGSQRQVKGPRDGSFGPR